MLSSLFWLSCSSTKQSGAPLSYDPPGSTNTKTKTITYQDKGEFTIAGVTLNNDYPGARLNGFTQLNDSLFQIVISPENEPINMSPWYSFRIKGETEKKVFLHLKYTFGKHRYYPDVSKDGINWQPIDSMRYTVHENDSAVLAIDLTQEYQYISAQELLTSKANAQWLDQVQVLEDVSPVTYGKSREGKSLRAIQIGMTKRQPTLIIISRQHPPEVTGYMAMKAFVSEILSDSRLSSEFRSKFTILLVPMMNPDGVDNGHWRHNAGGVDLNRDWQYYHQPEIDQFQEFIKNVVKKNKLKVVLGLDFHSTHEDLLYTFNNETFPDGKGVVKEWIRRLRSKFPQESITEEDGGAESPVSKNWFLHEFKAEAVTYEVGDDTPREQLKQKGKIAAQLFMELLLTKYTR